MISQNTLEKITHEYNHGGIQANHPELTTVERNALIKYLLKGGKCLDGCYLCEEDHTA
jgi:hypothetical protein